MGCEPCTNHWPHHVSRPNHCCHHGFYQVDFPYAQSHRWPRSVPTTRATHNYLQSNIPSLPTSRDSNSGEGVARVLGIEEDRGSFHRRTTIEMLPDDVLVDLFDFYIMMGGTQGEDRWHTPYTCVGGGDPSFITTSSSS